MNDMDMTYSTIHEVVDQLVGPSLGACAHQYDIEGIARAITEWHSEEDHKGNELLNRSGFRLKVTEEEYWQIVEKFEIGTDNGEDQ